MIDRWATSLTLMLSKDTNMTNEDSQKICYALNVILQESIKLILLFAIFIIINKLNLFLFSLSILISIRTFSGGFHFESNIKCFFVSLIFFLLSCSLSQVAINVPISYYHIAALLSIIIIAIGAPKPSKNRPIRSIKRKQNLKILSIIFTILWYYILFFYVKNSYLLKCGMLTIIMQSVQLLNINKLRRDKSWIIYLENLRDFHIYVQCYFYLPLMLLVIQVPFF